MPENKQKGVEDDLLTTSEAARILRISPSTLAQWRCNGKHKIPTVKFGTRVLYRLTDLKKFIKENTKL